MLDINHLPNPVPNEKLVYFLRRHPITLLNLALSFAIVFSAPFVAFWYVISYQPTILQQPVATVLLLLAASAAFLFAWLFLYQLFLDYHLDLWVVTTKRILNIEQTGLFSRTVSELRLYRIQDVTSTVSGVLHTIFDYGDVEIQTAGEKARFVFEEVPRPNRIAKTILELSEIDRREHLNEAVEEFGMADKAKAHDRAHASEILEP